MAQDGKEHKMLFDIRSGRRGNVVKVVYGVLAVLMGLSLFLTVGPVNIGEIFGGESAGTSEAAERLEDEAARIETKLVKDPENEELLLRLTRNHTSTANILAERGPNGELVISPDARQQYEQASGAWSEYLEATDEPSTGAAQLMSTTLFTLANNSPSFRDAVNNVAGAAEAQQIVAERRPSIGSLSTAALYTLYTFDYAEAEKLLDQAMKSMTSKAERASLQQRFDATKKAAENFEKEFKEVQKIEAQANSAGEKNPQESLQNPFGLGTGTGTAE